jgi:hypothetical protein
MTSNNQETKPLLRKGDKLARALELSVRSERAEVLSRTQAAAELAADLDVLEQRLAELGDWNVRRGEVSADQVMALARSDGSMLVEVDDGWLSTSGGRAYWVGADGERRIKLGAPLQKLTRGKLRDALLLEPRLALKALESPPGSSASPWWRLRALLRMESGSMSALVVYAIVVGGLSLAVPVAVQVLVNTIALGSVDASTG